MHLFKTPLLLKKKQLLPQETHKMNKFLYLFKTPPPLLDSFLIGKKYKSDLYIILNSQQFVLARFSPVSTPFLPGREKKGEWWQKVASMRLKIGQQVAYR